MIDEIQGWREYRADLTLEEIRGLEQIEVGLSRLFPGMPDNHYRSTLLPQIACDRAELNRVTGTKPADDMPVPAGATAGPWEWDRERGARWQRRLTWMRFEPQDYDPFFGWSVSIQGMQYADGSFTKVISAIGARDLTPGDARTMAVALDGAAGLMEPNSTDHAAAFHDEHAITSRQIAAADRLVLWCLGAEDGQDPEDVVGDCVECWRTIAVHLANWLVANTAPTIGSEEHRRFIDAVRRGITEIGEGCHE